MRIGIVTPLYPTAREPYRGAPLWNTLRELQRDADLVGGCILPEYPLGIAPRTFRYHRAHGDTNEYGVPSRTVPYFSLPGIGMLKGRLIQSALRKAWEPDRPDLILSYWVHPDSYAAVRLGEEWNIPVVVGARGSDLRLIPHRGVVRRQIEYTVRNASAVLCVSAELSQIARELGARRDTVHTIRNGIDPSIFRWKDQPGLRKQFGLAAGEIWVLFVGWLSKLKGVHRLMEAITILNRENGPKWGLAMIGEGYLEPDLRRQALVSKFGSCFRFLGALKAPDIADWLCASDLFCLPSESEGCPNVVLEALACGTPVVGSDVGGIPELLNERCGVLVPGEDTHSLAAALRQAAERPWNRKQISISQQRSWGHVALETIDVCKRVLSQHEN